MLAQKLRRGVVAGLGSIIIGGGPLKESGNATAPNQIGTVELDRASSLVWVDGLLALYDSEPNAHSSASRLALLSWKEQLAQGRVPRGLSPRFGDKKPHP